MFCKEICITFNDGIGEFFSDLERKFLRFDLLIFFCILRLGSCDDEDEDGDEVTELDILLSYL